MMLSKQDQELIKIAYDKCFDQAGNMKACGRDACISLLCCLNRVKPHVSFGNIHTGFLNVDAINEFFKNDVIRGE